MFSALLSSFAPSDMTWSWAGPEIFDPQVQVDLLLGCAIRPVGRDVVRCQLHSHLWFTVDEHHMPVILGIDGAVEYPGPEPALGCDVGCVEDDDLMVDAHRVNPFVRVP